MPVALLLQNVFAAFRNGALGTPRTTGLIHWVRLVSLEETLIDRARGAFLVRWFGPHLPLHGRDLRVSIVNLAALRERYTQVQQAVAPEPTGLNLLEPLSGFAGVMAGAVLSPTGGALLIAAALRKLPGWARVLLGIIGGPLFIPLAIGFSVFGKKKPEEGKEKGGGLLSLEFMQEVHASLGALARLIDSFLRFIGVLTGPLENVKNPLLSAVLGIFDGLAKLIPYATVMIAILLVHVGRQVLPLARQAVAFIGLADAVMDTLSFIARDIGGQLDAITLGNDSPLGVLKRTFSAVGKMLSTVVKQLVDTSKKMADTFLAWKDSLAPRVKQYLGWARDFIKWVFFRHFVGKAVRAALKQLDAIKAAFARQPPKPPEPPSKAMAGVSKVLGWVLPTPPPRPELKLPEASAVEAQVGGAPLLPLAPWAIHLRASLLYPLANPRAFLFGYQLSPEAVAGLERARETASVFAVSRRRLAAELGMSPQEALEAARQEELKLFERMGTIAGHVLPPEIRAEMPSLRGMLLALDAWLHHTPKETKPEGFPVKDLPEGRHLRPVVHRLHIRHSGGYAPRVREFREQLIGILRKQSYPVVAET